MPKSIVPEITLPYKAFSEHISFGARQVRVLSIYEIMLSALVWLENRMHTITFNFAHMCK